MGTRPPAALLRPITEAGVTVDAVVDGHIIGDMATVSSASYTIVISYLLAWNLLLSFLHCTSAELRVQFAQYIRRVNLVSQLMSHVFRLLPNSPIIPVLSSLPSDRVSFSLCCVIYVILLFSLFLVN